MKIRKILREKRGEATVLTVALILGLLLLMCAMAEFFRLAVIVQGVRDGLTSSVITVATTNYDETYNGLREGYSGGYLATAGRKTLTMTMCLPVWVSFWERIWAVTR